MKWYKHDSDAGSNPDLRLLIASWGWDWYGRWWGIVERVAVRVSDRDLSFSLQTNNGQPFPVELLARELGTTVQRLSDFCSFLADNRLIDPDSWKDKNLIFIPNLKKRTDEYTRKLLTKSGVSPDQEKEEEVDKKNISGSQPPPAVDQTSWEYRTARDFYESVKAQYPTLVNDSLEKVARLWVDALQQLQRLDGHSQDQIIKVLRFVESDPFWSEQIRALPKLRKKDRQQTPYFNLMLVKAETAGRRNGHGGPREGDDTLEGDPGYIKFAAGLKS